MAEIRDKFGLSGAGVARGPRRLLDRGALREEPLPGGDIGFRIGDGE